MNQQKKPVTGWQRTVVVGLDKFIYRFSKHWIWFFNAIVFIYVGLPILAPVLMNAGVEGPARTIYFVYRPMCHQMASRSFFLFGEQYAYPRELAGTDLTPIEAYMSDIPEFSNVPTDPNQWGDFMQPARLFLGNEQMGYKMALCERDIAIYGAVFLAGVLYALVRRRWQIKPLPFWAFLLVGMGPIAFDGFSQLFSQMGVLVDLLSAITLRESTPFLRTFTGAVFGASLVWLAYPRINVGMQENADALEEKLKRIGELE